MAGADLAIGAGAPGAAALAAAGKGSSVSAEPAVGSLSKPNGESATVTPVKAKQENKKAYDAKTTMTIVAAVVLTLGLVFFALTAGNVLPFLKPAVLGGVPAAAALAFASGVAAIIAAVCANSCRGNRDSAAKVAPDAAKPASLTASEPSSATPDVAPAGAAAGVADAKGAAAGPAAH